MKYSKILLIIFIILVKSEDAHCIRLPQACLFLAAILSFQNTNADVTFDGSKLEHAPHTILKWAPLKAYRPGKKGARTQVRALREKEVNEENVQKGPNAEMINSLQKKLDFAMDCLNNSYSIINKEKSLRETAERDLETAERGRETAKIQRNKKHRKLRRFKRLLGTCREERKSLQQKISQNKGKQTNKGR